MYLWKCWRDTRSAFLGIVATLLAIGIFGAYVKVDPLGWIAAKPESSRVLWHVASDALGASLAGAIPIAGFILGAMGVGVEFERGTADFLLTRPRSRRSLFWTSWSLGAAQILALVLLALAINWLTRPNLSAARPALFSRVPLATGTVALLIYSLTYLMTTVARSSRNGIGLSVAALTGYNLLHMWLIGWHGVTVPIVWALAPQSGLLAACMWLGSVLGWLAVCLTLMLFTQVRFERAEL